MTIIRRANAALLQKLPNSRSTKLLLASDETKDWNINYIRGTLYVYYEEIYFFDLFLLDLISKLTFDNYVSKVLFTIK